MDARFLSSFTDPAPNVKVLGRFVSPFCLRHRVTLTAADSPILKANAGVRPIDLLVAVKICAGEPLGKLTWRDHLELWKMTNRDSYFESQIKLFGAYALTEAWPKFWEKSTKSGGTNTTPWMLTVVCNLIANGIPEERAWTMPESQAIWMHSGFAIMNGAQLKVLTTEEEQTLEELNKTLNQ